MTMSWRGFFRGASARPNRGTGPGGQSVPAPQSRLAAARARMWLRARAWAWAMGLASVCVCATSIMLFAVAPVRADVFGPISLVSEGSVDGGPAEQVEYAHDAAISADGRYITFDGSIGGVTGVWRRDLASDVIEQVAGGGASRPSISANGQYVSFTTDEGARLAELSHDQIDSEPEPESQNVYVRDMANQPAASAAVEAAWPRAARAFQIVSAPSGSEEPLRYAAPTSSQQTTVGSFAVGRSAISASGEEVVFMTEARSNLVPYPELEEEERRHGEKPQPHTPAGQVAVRHLDPGATEPGVTELVSRCRFACATGAAAGAVEPVTVSEPEAGKLLGAGSGGASISADGSTVAWMGYNIAQQAPMLSAEALPADYTEPLWRRLPAAANQTRRVSGGSEPENPACVASGETAVAPGSENASDPCQGPFVVELGTGGQGSGFLGKGNTNGGPWSSTAPQLSENGEEVAFVSEARLLAEGGGGSEGHAADLFVVDMRPGLTRAQALKQITEVGFSVASEDAGIVSFAISPEGTQVAFTTVRTIFTLGEPTLIDAPLPNPGINELYDADLANETITRVTHGYEGGASEQPHRIVPQEKIEDPYEPRVGEQLGAFSPAFGEDGDELVFTSTADNLVYGDGNTPPGEPVIGTADGSDVFAAQRTAFQAQPTPQQISPAPQIPLAPAWRLGVSARSLSDGSVLLYVRAPGPGALHAGASGAVVAAFVHAASAAGKRGREATSPPTRMGAGTKVLASQASRAGGRPKTRPIAKTVVTRTVAAGSLQTSGPGLSALKLSLARSYGALARERGGFSATVTITFTATGHQTLRATVPVIFAREIVRAKASAHKARARGTRSSKVGERS